MSETITCQTCPHNTRKNGTGTLVACQKVVQEKLIMSSCGKMFSSINTFGCVVVNPTVGNCENCQHYQKQSLFMHRGMSVMVCRKNMMRGCGIFSIRPRFGCTNFQQKIAHAEVTNS